MNRNPVGWFEIYVQDMARALAFYEATFQARLERLESPEVELWAFPGDPDMPGCGGALVRKEGKDSGGGGTIIYFSCEDCAVVAARAARNGGEIQREKFSIGSYGFVSYVFDPEGNLLGLHSLR